MKKEKEKPTKVDDSNMVYYKKEPPKSEDKNKKDNKK